MGANCKVVACMGFLAMTCLVGYASDPNQLQGFCIGINDPNAAMLVNGLLYKNPKNVTANDFFFEGIAISVNTKNKVVSNVTLVTATNFPGLNTLDVAMARINFAPYGENPPHLHPRGTEILTVLKGALLVGFITSNQDGNRFISKVLKKGEMFVFP
ncbi:hypothetical protein Ancab_037600 [Ancistrocladus abbreviatus]